MVYKNLFQPHILSSHPLPWLYPVRCTSVFVVVQSLRCVWPYATPWTAARQASLSISNSQSLLKLMSIKLVMPSNHLILCHPLLLLPSISPSIRVFSNESALCIVTKRLEPTSASVLPVTIQDWFPLGWTGWISSQSKGLSRVFSQHHSSKASILQHSALQSSRADSCLLSQNCQCRCPSCTYYSQPSFTFLAKPLLIFTHITCEI